MIVSVKSKYDNDDNDGDGYEIIIKFVKKSFFFLFYYYISFRLLTFPLSLIQRNFQLRMNAY